MRTSRLVSLLVPLVLLLTLGATQAASADGEGEASAVPFEPAIELSEEAEWVEECVEEGPEEEGEDSPEVEAEEECEAEAEDAGFSPAEDCYLRTARAHVVAYPSRNTVRLTLGYTTYAPARATVEYSASNDGRLGTVSRSLGHSGVVRLSKHLGAREMNRVQASHRLTVAVHVPETPRDCQRFAIQRLQVERSSDSRITWSEDR